MNEYPKTIDEWADWLSETLDRFIDPEENECERSMVTEYWKFRAEKLGQSTLPFGEEESE